jgi:DNA-binding MarR family transcriptional regulator
MRIPNAAILSVLQALAWAERHHPDRPVRPSDLAAALDVHRSAITRHLQALEQAGHVTVTADSEDGRSWVVGLTDTGRAEVARLTETGMDRFAAFVADWEAADVQTLSRLLMRFERSRAEVAQREPAPERPRRRRPGRSRSAP